MTPTRRPSRDALVRALLVLAVGVGAVVGIPSGRSAAAPETVVRSAPIATTALIGRRVALSSAGVGAGGGAPAPTRAVTVCAPIWFDGVAFTWKRAGGRPPTLFVAAGRTRSSLEAAEAVDTEGGPDPGTPDARAIDARDGSEYVWTGGSRCVRVRFDLPAGTAIDDVRAVFLNTSGTAEGPGTGPREVGPSLDGGASLPAANAMTREPNLITRSQWGANPKLMNCTPDVASFLTNAFVHHTAGSNGYSRAEADDVVRGVYAYHTQVRGWCDIGYNFLVDRYGDVFEGRSGGVTNNVIGAAQMGFNTGAFSVSMMGTFSTVAPPAAAIRALERILAWRLDVAHLDPTSRHTMTSGGGSTTRYPRGTEVRLHTISGHRDTGLTDCPGGRLYALLRRIRRAVDRKGLPKLYDPRLSVSSVVATQPTSIRIRARGSASLRWSVTVLDASDDVVAALPRQRADRLDLRWRAELDAPGEYRVVVTARRAGRAARPAELSLVAEPPPSPSPTATPSPTSTPG